MAKSDRLAKERKDEELDEILKILRRGITPVNREIDHDWICGTPFLERPLRPNPNTHK